ncbi:hypothetical protein [Thermosyntropha lipolytica]|uniref:hypothetical protein n=1 Tax=Thermosyntropha lipolytica TaxID=54294 RepID=UPI001160CD64|nr:hypothetical protein [Thermosyntropha lipolytica]
MLFLWTLIFFPGQVEARGSEVEVSLILRDDKKIVEKVVIKEPWPEAGLWYDNQFTLSDGKLIGERKAENWEEYNALMGSFPLEVQVKNRILWDNYIIRSNYGKNKLVDDLTLHADKVVFSLQIPGIIKEASASTKEGNRLVWVISSDERPDIYVRAVVIDGFRLALFILGIGILLAFGYFISAVLKVNKIIEEEYSLNMPETAENEEKNQE